MSIAFSRQSAMACGQRGVSLVELMVALVLSLILMAGVGQIYLGSKQTYRVQDGQSRMQENARYAFEVLNRSIRPVGYIGCKPFVPAYVPTDRSCPTSYNRSAATDLWCQPNPPSIIAKTPAIAPTTAAMALSGADDNTGLLNNPSPVLYRSLTAQNDKLVLGTDAITVQYASSCGATVVAAPISKDSLTVSSANTCGSIAPSACGAAGCTSGRVLAVANCEYADVFRASAVTVNADNTVTLAVNANANTGTLHAVYRPGGGGGGGEVMLFNSYTYYIRLNPSGEPSLYRFDNNANNSDEVVEGIENMQILYGEDTDVTPDSAANQYVTAAAVNNWARVVSVRVILTIRSVGESAKNLTGQPNPPRSYNGNNNYVDSRLVKNFSTTISLSNRLQSRVNLP